MINVYPLVKDNSKAIIIEIDNNKYLKSYNTIMASFDENNNIHRYSDYKSHTTSKHLKLFGIDNIKNFYSLPLEKTNVIS